MDTIKIDEKTYIRIKIHKKFTEEAEKELKTILRLQGAPIVPTLLGHTKKSDNLWILMEELTERPDTGFLNKEIMLMIKDSAVFMRIIEAIEIAEGERYFIKQINPSACFFDSERRLKYFPACHNENGVSIIGNLFSLIERKEKNKEEKVPDLFY
jgi:hypothetical protein